MKKDSGRLAATEEEIRDENYYKNIVPAWLGQEENFFADSGCVPEVPEDLLLLDKELARQETEEYIEASTAVSIDSFFDESGLSMKMHNPK